MFKNKYPLKLLSIISLAIIVLTTIFVAIFGVNTSVEIGGGYQLEVKLSYEKNGEYFAGTENAETYLEKTKDVLDSYGCKVDSYFVEDKLVDTYLIVRIADAQVEGANNIAGSVALKLGLNTTDVAIHQLSSYFTNNIMLYIGLAILTVIIICFFAGWLRYSLMGGITLAFAVLHNLILSLALIFLTRVQFSMVSLVAVLALTVYSIFAFTSILERVKENNKSKQYAELTHDQKLISATKQNKHLYLICIILLAVSLAIIFVPVRYIQLAAVSVQLAVIACVFTFTFIAPALYAYLADFQTNKEKQKLSKNVVQKTAKNKQK